MPESALQALAKSSPADDELARLRRENQKLRRINEALIAHAERGTDPNGSGFALFQTAAALGNQVQERTAALSAALGELEGVNLALTRAKEEQEQAKQRLAFAIEAINQGIVLCDADDRVVVTNRRYREVWGGLAAEPGTPFSDLVHNALASDLLVGAGAEWGRVRMERHREPGEPFVIQFRNGIWLQVSERRVAGGGTVSLYTDITEIKRDEARRRERELAVKSILLQATLDNLSQGVSVFSGHADLAACNAGFLSFLHSGDDSDTDEALPGETVSDWCRRRLDELGLRFVYGGDEPETASPLREFRSPDGRTIEIRRSLMPDGGYVATYTDITERLRYLDALREANEGLERRVSERTAELSRANVEISAAKAEAELVNLSKTKFFAAANHDLLQPLAAARVFASALSERRLSAQNRELVRHALSALDSVDDLLTALLDIAKLDAGVMPPAPCAFWLRDVVGPVGKEYGMIASRKRLRLRAFAGDVVVRSDPRLLARILRNLVSNALRYTATGGVLIGHLRHPDGVLVGVWDTGIGIPEEQQEEIFEEFRRLPQGSDRTERGAGLGLSIVRRVCRMLGHKLVVRSVPGRGSLFGVVLPISGEPPVSLLRPTAVTDNSSGANALRGRSVQLIDDEPHVLQALSVLLEGWGMRVSGAACPADALLSSPPDLIIADYRLDGPATGLDAIATLRRRWGDLPAIVVTADYAPEVTAAVAAEGHHLLHKPVRPARLRSLITHILSAVPFEA